MVAYVILIDITILLILSFVFAFFVQQAYNVVFKGYAPFVPTKKKIINNIINNLDLPEDCVIYELGCGRAGFLRAARLKFPKAKLVGFENQSVLFWQAKIQNWLHKADLDIQRKDIFEVNLKEADLVYCYLNENMMTKLKEMFQNEMKEGEQVVSFQYKIPGIDPVNVLQGDKARDKVYFYKF